MNKVRVAFIMLILGSIASCTRFKVDEDTFNKVKLGMSINEVVMILGEPDQKKVKVDSSIGYFYAISEKIFSRRYAEVSFDKAGKVYFKLYRSPN